MIRRIIAALTPELVKQVRAERHAWEVLRDIEQQRTAQNGQNA